MSDDEIFKKVSATLVDALAVDEDEVKGEATLSGDLGAESIDFLDIVFRLEKNFGIKIPKGELFPDEKLFTDPEYVQDGKLTSKGIDELRARLPFADVDDFAKNPETSRINDLYTVDTIVRYIATKLDKKG
jgi:acyl carrier protein